MDGFRVKKNLLQTIPESAMIKNTIVVAVVAKVHKTKKNATVNEKP